MYDYLHIDIRGLVFDCSYHLLCLLWLKINVFLNDLFRIVYDIEHAYIESCFLKMHTHIDSSAKTAVTPNST